MLELIFDYVNYISSAKYKHNLIQSDLVDNLAFCLCTGVGPQNRPIRKKNLF